MHPTVSVCMPASRDHAWFRRALRSVLEQSCDDLEVVVSDDSGGSLEAAAHESEDPRVRYVPHPARLGLAGNHQAAIDASSGRYLAFLHDDDEWHRDHLERAVAVLDREPAVGMVISACDEVDEHGRLLRRRPSPIAPGTQSDVVPQLLRDDFQLMLPSISVFRRSALDADNRRPWPDVPAADMTMYVDLAAAGWLLHYTGQATACYRMHSSQVGSDQLVHRDAVVQVWSGYSFPDPVHERLRRRRLAKDLHARAGELVRRGESERAKRDLVDARRLSPWAGLPRATALRALVLSPRFTPVAERIWHRVSSPRPADPGGGSAKIT